jgi:hypothetical protein
MLTAVRVSLAILCAVAIGTPVAAKSRAGAVAPLSVHAPVFQPGRTTQAQSFKPLQIPVTPHKPADAAKPSPSASPEFNPLKHRRMAMPAMPSGGSELAF